MKTITKFKHVIECSLLTSYTIFVVFHSNHALPLTTNGKDVTMEVIHFVFVLFSQYLFNQLKQMSKRELQSAADTAWSTLAIPGDQVELVNKIGKLLPEADSLGKRKDSG